MSSRPRSYPLGNRRALSLSGFSVLTSNMGRDACLLGTLNSAVVGDPRCYRRMGVV